MRRLWLLRHARTAWSVDKRLQGRRDIALDEAGRRQAGGWRLPHEARASAWFTSPLTRCRQTAALLMLTQTSVEPRLIEMDWGQWEGRTRSELRQSAGTLLAHEEAKGLDLQPPGGESPRAVQARLSAWLAERGNASVDSGAVTHQGVIRAVYALASDWQMLEPPPTELEWNAIHCFRWTTSGRIEVHQLNIPLTEAQ